MVRDLSFPSGLHHDVCNVNFEAGPGDCILVRSRVLVLGTRLLQCLIGQQAGARGSVVFDGVRIVPGLPQRRLLALRARIGFVYRDHGLISLLSVQENIALPLGYHRDLSKQALWAAVREVSELLGITHLLGRRVIELSGVEQRLVNLARELVREPHLLLVDGMLEGLSVDHKERMLKTLNHYQDDYGFAVVMTTRSAHPAVARPTRFYDLTEDGLVPLLD
jgi:ABC-type lipoprotein export system ATPase subunit